MITTTKQDMIIKSYLLDNIDLSNYEDYTQSKDADNIDSLVKIFKSEYGHELVKKGRHKALEGWLMGLPSSINVPYAHHEIIELGHEWGLLKKEAADTEEGHFCNQWWGLIAGKLGELMDGFNVPERKGD